MRNRSRVHSVERVSFVCCLLALACTACIGNAANSTMGSELGVPTAGKDGAAQGGRSDGGAPSVNDADTRATDDVDAAVRASDGAVASMRDARATGADAAADAAVASAQVRPLPMSLISVKRPVVTSGGTGSWLVDDAYFDLGFWDVAVADKPWAALDLARGPSRIVVQLYASQPDTIPRAYRLESSADSSNGRDGVWTVRAMVKGNDRTSRLHVLEFSGQRWLRVVIEEAAASGGGRVRLNELAVRDASQGASDSWIFIGDSITAITYHPGPKSFSGLVHTVQPMFYPVMVNAGIGGTNTNDGLADLDKNLALFPEVQNWVISYGTNDAANGDPSYAPAFARNLREIIQRLQRAGKSVFVPRIPYKASSDVSAYNAALDEVVASTGAFRGPDLYAYFSANKGALSDGVHPNDQGSAAMNRLWAEAVAPLYR
jgi:lysophospholipase L1-like esterase